MPKTPSLPLRRRPVKAESRLSVSRDRKASVSPIRCFAALKSPRNVEHNEFCTVVSFPPPATSQPRRSVASGAQQPVQRPRAFIQLHGSYIVEETEGGINLIDQHALHERILYNVFKRRRQERSVTKQKLLVPELVELSSRQFFLAMQLRHELNKVPSLYDRGVRQ